MKLISHQDEKLLEKRQQIAAAEAKIARLKTEINRQTRADDTRRKVLIGSFIMASTSADPSKIAMLRLNGKTLNDYLVRSADRKLFGLSPLSEDGP